MIEVSKGVKGSLTVVNKGVKGFLDRKRRIKDYELVGTGNGVVTRMSMQQLSEALFRVV